MCQLNPYSVVHCNENEKQTVGQEVVLIPHLVQKFIVLARFLIHLHWSDMDGIVPDKSTSKPESCEKVVTKELDQKLEQVDILHLSLLWVLPRFYNLHEIAYDDKEGHQSHDSDNDLADR